MLMMMGTAAEIPQAPKEKTVFMEDMTESQLAATVSKLGPICAHFLLSCYQLPLNNSLCPGNIG